jgi:hypothetical protein
MMIFTFQFVRKVLKFSPYFLFTSLYLLLLGSGIYFFWIFRIADRRRMTGMPINLKLRMIFKDFLALIGLFVQVGTGFGFSYIMVQFYEYATF